MGRRFLSVYAQPLTGVKHHLDAARKKVYHIQVLETMANGVNQAEAAWLVSAFNTQFVL